MSVTEGSGNVFRDMGLPDPEDRETKARIALIIEGIIEGRSWTQAEAAERMGVSQPELSRIVRGRLSDFTLDRLISCLNLLDQDVEITVRPARHSPGRTFVAAPP